MLNENTGEETAYLYYPSGAVRNIIKRNGKEVDRQYYEYDKDGNRTLEMGSGSVKQYTYDEQNRLKRCITDLNYITDYWYDEYNNITVTRTLSGGAAYLVYYEYDENNRLISSNDGHQTTTYAYDANGNMLRSDGEETTDYIFNGAGELAEVWKDNSVYSYEYDHTGLRTGKTVDGVTTSMITDGMYVVAEYVGANSTYYYRGMNLIGYVSDAEIGYYRFNAHGDVVAVVDTAGEIITEYSYDPFGKLEDDENEWLKILFGIYVEDRNPFRYCAEYFDTETEFIYLRARYYSPDLQRFISEDPVRDGNNWYAYCGNNPVMFSDPLGCAFTDDDRKTYESLIEQGRIDEADAFKYQIDHATKEYILAEKTGDYGAMNAAHKSAAMHRQRYYTYIDDYDYSEHSRPSLYIPVSATGELTQSHGESIIELGMNNDGTWSLYDNQRFKKDGAFHEQILAVSASSPLFNIDEKGNGSIGLGMLEVTAITGGWEWESLDLSLLDFFRAYVAAEVDSSGLNIGAVASVWSPSITITIFGVEISLGAEVGAVEGTLNVDTGSFELKGAWAIGASIKIAW